MSAITPSGDIPLQYFPLLISLLSLCISFFSLGWNIYRDVVMKPRVKVAFSVGQLHDGISKPQHRLWINVTNFGPGILPCELIVCKADTIWKRLRRRTEHAFINYKNVDQTGQLPARLQVGERLTLLLPYTKDCMLAEPFTHIGVLDSFGRYHWAKRQDYIRAQRTFSKDFPTTVIK
jgi:hypothetical protein